MVNTTSKKMEQELKLAQFSLDHAHDAIFRMSKNAKIIYVNAAACEHLGYTKDELLMLSIPDIDPDFSQELWDNEHLKDVDNTILGPFETRHKRKDGTIVPVEITCRFMEFDGELYYLATVRNITERKYAENDLKLAALVYQNSNEAMIVTDAENRIVAINPAFYKLTGYTEDEVLGKNPKLLSSGRQDEEFYQTMWGALNNIGSWQGEIWNRRKNGEVYAEWLSINTIYNDDGVYQRVALFTDITERKNNEAIIWGHANFDSLTQLPNRHLFTDRLEQEIKKAKRDKFNIALLFIDLDHFKEVNDTLGHDMGDLLLIEAARRIQNCVRNVDTVARLGGDEFMVILSELNDSSDIERIAQNIIKCLSEHCILNGLDAYVTASIGTALFPDDASTLAELIKHADQAMYAAKNNGRNCMSSFASSSPLETHTRIL